MTLITFLDNLIVVKLVLTEDEGFLNDLSSVRNLCEKESVRIIIQTDLSNSNIFVSANTICNYLTFVEELLSNKDNVSITIRLFEQEALKEALFLCQVESRTPNIENFKKRLRFYFRWEIADQLYRIKDYYETNGCDKLSCYPSSFTFKKLIKKYRDDVFFDKEKFSSTLMPLSALDSDEYGGINKVRADKRIRNLTYILWTHFFNKEVSLTIDETINNKSLEKLNQLRHLSAVLMYELIKNIYQHASSNSKTSMLGFTTVQMNKKSTLNSTSNTYFPNMKLSKAHQKINLASILDSNDSVNQNAGDLQFLTISICDFGIGIPNSIKKAMVHKAEQYDDLHCIKSAIFTPLTTKKETNGEEDPEFYYSSEEKIRLSRRGFGWITAALFIGSQMGSFNITSNKISVTYRTTTEGYGKILELLEKKSTMEAAEDIFKFPLEIFEEQWKNLPDEQNIAGTRIIIELPVINKWGKTYKNK